MNKFLRAFVVVLIITISTTNATTLHTTFSDTTLLAGTVTKHDAGITEVEEPSNVLFPSILEAHREQSLEYIHKFSEKKRNYLIQVYNQGIKIFPKVISILNRYELPSELKVLIALESGFNPNAISSAGAVGYWQLMDEVAKDYGLKIINAHEKLSSTKKLKDDRKNFNKSTSAAARYLKDRARNLNDDILLIVAAYNCGVGHIQNAMKRCGKPNPTFWDIKKFLPTETRNYVMNFIALNVIFLNYENFSNRSLVFYPQTLRIINPVQSTLRSDSTGSVIL